jgi:hypothetical protein
MIKSISELINIENFEKQVQGFTCAKPFNYAVIDKFFDGEIALRLAEEFPDYSSDVWRAYMNPLEDKKLCNHWDKFPPLTYSVLSALNSQGFVALLQNNLGLDDELSSDFGLNGGGWHIHRRGGKLNTHLDYSLHPKTKMQRKLNLIIYLNPNWQPQWGGSLGLWGNDSHEAPGPLEKKIDSCFNRAIIFDTTMNSWHGLPEPIQCPEDEYRKSLAVYYLCDAPENISERGKALFAPTEDQKGDSEILELIKRRSSTRDAENVYSRKP